MDVSVLTPKKEKEEEDDNEDIIVGNENVEEPRVIVSPRSITISEVKDENSPVVAPEIVVSPRASKAELVRSPIRRKKLSTKKRSEYPSYKSPSEIKLDTRILEYSKMSPKERLEIKNKFKIKLDMLKEEYPNMDPPIIGENIELEEIHEIYETYLNRALSIESVPFYTVFLFFGFLIIQYIVEKLFKIDMSGFAELQIASMTRYRRILIKLGEKRKISIETNWGPEVSLCVAVLFQAVIFGAVKVILGGKEKDGKDDSKRIITSLNSIIDGMMNSFTNQRSEMESKPLHERQVSKKSNGGAPDIGGLLGGLGGLDLGGLLKGLGGGRNKDAEKEPDYEE